MYGNKRNSNKKESNMNNVLKQINENVQYMFHNSGEKETRVDLQK